MKQDRAMPEEAIATHMEAAERGGGMAMAIQEELDRRGATRASHNFEGVSNERLIQALGIQVNAITARTTMAIALMMHEDRRPVADEPDCARNVNYEVRKVLSAWKGMEGIRRDGIRFNAPGLAEALDELVKAVTGEDLD